MSATNSDTWRPLTYVTVDGRRYDLTDVEIRQQIELHDLRLDLCRAKDDNLSILKDRDLYRHHLRDALEALNQPKCDTCNGSGGVEIFAGPTPMDEVVVGYTKPEDECCSDCCGSGKDLK